MKKQFTLLAIALITLTSCNPLSKSILEELTIQEIKSASDKDSLFQSDYKRIELLKEAAEDDKLILAKYSELTYQDLIDYRNYEFDTEMWEDRDAQSDKEWTKLYQKTRIKGVNFVKDFIKRKKEFERVNDPTNYVKIELIGINTRYYEYSGGVRDVSFKFRITPKKGRLDQVVWEINPTAKIDGEPDKSSIRYVLDKQGYIYSRPISSTTVGSYEASYDHKDLAAGKSSKSFLRDYNLNLKINKVRYNGKNLELDGFDTPSEIKNYIKYGEKDDEYMQELYLDDIIKENIDSEYLSKRSYANEQRRLIKEKEYPLEYSFFEELTALVLEKEDFYKRLRDIYN